MITEWDTNDIIFVPMQVKTIEIYDGKTFYKVKECEELIPESKIVCGLHVKAIGDDFIAKTNG